MAPKHLSVVSDQPQSEVYDLGKGPESIADRVKRLQHEARILAREETETLERKIAEVVALANEIAGGGDAYPAGVRELCSRISADSDQKGQTLKALVERTFGE